MDNNNFHIAKFNNKTKLPQLQIVDNFEFNNSKILDKTAYGNFGYRDTVDKPMDTQVDYQMYEPFYDSDDDSESNTDSDSESEENNGVEGFRGRRRRRHRRRRILRRPRRRRRIIRRRSRPRRRIIRRPIQRKTPKFAPHDIRNYIGKNIRFRTAFKKYITMLPNGRVGSEFANDRNIFKVIDGRNGTFAFHNKTYNVFLRAHVGGFLDRSGKRNANQLPHNWSWERFKVFFRHGGYYIETFHKNAILVQSNGNVIQGKIYEGIGNANTNRIQERVFIEDANKISSITRDEQKLINDVIALKKKKEKNRLEKIKKEKNRLEKIKKEISKAEKIKRKNERKKIKKIKTKILKVKKEKQQKIKDALEAKRIATEEKEDLKNIKINKEKKKYIQNEKIGDPLKKIKKIKKNKNIIQDIQKYFESVCTIL